jgi:DEAD/DEAH box helicase domain-containing protein
MAFHAELPKADRLIATDMVLRGQVPWVAATSTLEVGVDIGNMDVCICLGHPGDMASLGQRFGRVARTTPGTVYLVLDENQGPMNTYLQANPAALHGTPESRTVYPSNKILATRHAACAFLETGSLDVVKKFFPGVNMREVIDLSRRLPHKTIAMRGGIGDFGQFVALAPDGTTEIAKLSGEDALLNWHMGAVIRHQAGFSSKSYRVTSLSTASESLFAYTEPLPACVSKIYTSPVRNRVVNVEAAELAPAIQSTLIGISDAITGDFDVKEQTVGYKQFTWEVGARKPDKEEIELEPEQRNPSIAFRTRGVELHLTRENPIADCILGLGAEPELLCDALTDAMHKTLPLVVQARPDDVELIIKPAPMNEGRVTAITFQFFDVVDGGMGWSEAAGARLKDWLRASALLLKNCGCKGEGCPRCTFHPVELLDRRDMVDAVIAATR